MSQETQREQWTIGGMTCPNCERRIGKKLTGLPGVTDALVSYSRSSCTVTYRPDKISREEILEAVRSMDYTAEPVSGRQKASRSLSGMVLMILALYLVLNHFGVFNLFNAFPQAEAGMGYGMLFVVGLLTSVHCVAMCGGINLSQCIPPCGNASGSQSSPLRPSLLYNLGRVISYTAVGGVVGAIGSVIQFSGVAKGIVQVAAGVFMVIMGLAMLGVEAPWLRRLVPRLPAFLARIPQSVGSNSPLVVGLLNGLMPCGPLQAMQLYALSTGDPLRGGLSMFLFSLGTVPLMFGLGTLSSTLTKRFTQRMMTVGAVLVAVLGLSLFGNGLALSGLSPLSVAQPQQQANVQTGGGVQIVETQLASRRYPAITVTAGVPVQWTIQAEQGTINGCNNRLFIPEYGIEKQLQVGDNLIEFTPDRSGVFTYSCWMGMIRSTITVAGADGTVAEGPEDAGDSYVPGFRQPQPSATPAGYQIPTDTVAVGELFDSYQLVSISMDDQRFSPAIVVVQYGVETLWTIENSSGAESLLFPAYYTQLPLEDGENQVFLMPVEDFDFSTGDNSFYGYVKVVEDLEDVDLEAVRAQVAAFETQIWSFD